MKGSLKSLLFLLISSTLIACGNNQGSSSVENSSTPVEPSTTPVDSSTPEDTSTVEVHKHSYESEWTFDEQGHHYACICHPEEIEVFAHEDNDGNKFCDQCQYDLREVVSYSVSAKDEAGRLLQYVKVNILEGEEVKESKITDETGTVTFEVLEGEYKVEITHLNEAYSLLEQTDITLSNDTPEYTAVFTETNERIGYRFNVYDQGGGIYQDAIIYVYDKTGYDEGALGINSAGYAVGMMYNGDYIYSIFYGDGYNQVGYIEKDGPSTIDIVLDYKENLGTKDNPILLYDIERKPFVYDDGLKFNWDYEFKENETIYAFLPNALGKEFLLDGTNFKASYNGIDIPLNENNQLQTFFDQLEVNETAFIEITAINNAVEDIMIIDNSSENTAASWFIAKNVEKTLNFYYEGQVKCYYIGTANIPYVTVSATNATLSQTEFVFEAGEGYYLYITAKSKGEVIVKIECFTEK